jgi:hypothetical protein
MVGQFLTGFQVSDNANEPLVVSHLLFSVDTLIFCGDDSDQLCYLKCVLLCFEAIWGLKIYLGKSKPVPVANVLQLED